MIDITRITDVEIQAELVKLRNDLSASQRELQELNSSHERLLADNQDLSRTLLQRARASGESTVLIERLNTMRTQLRDSERARDHAEADARELRSVMQQYVDQIKTAENLADDNEVHSLRQELVMVREQASQDVERMQAELERLQQDAGDSVAPHSDENAIELEVLRQETEALSASLIDRKQELQASQQTCQLLEDELEDAHAEIDEMRRKLEQQEARISELEQLACEEPDASDSAESESTIEDVAELDGQITSQPALDIQQVTRADNSARKRLLSMLTGAMILLASMELVSLSVGKGELFSSLFAPASPLQQQSRQTVEPEQPAEAEAPEHAAAGVILR